MLLIVRYCKNSLFKINDIEGISLIPLGRKELCMEDNEKYLVPYSRVVLLVSRTYSVLCDFPGWFVISIG